MLTKEQIKQRKIEVDNQCNIKKNAFKTIFNNLKSEETKHDGYSYGYLSTEYDL